MYSRARMKAVLIAPFSHVSQNYFPSRPTCSSYQLWGPFSSHRPVRTTNGSYSCLIWFSLEQHRRTRQKAASDAVGTSSASQNSPPMATSSSSEKTQLGQMAWVFNSHCAPGPPGHFDFIHFQDLISSWTFCSSIQSF